MLKANRRGVTAQACLAMSQALYRKYRSRSLKEVVGQEHITETLARALNAGHISHAYLFTGPRGVGKTSVARILAFEINKIPYSDTQQLDIIEIDAASNRRIDDIRDLREKVHIAPVNAPYKVYIIDEVHMLTGESFNALLKTLEEPPSHVIFILATTEAHKLPATIISRTQRFAFRPADKEKLVAHLTSIAKKEKINISPEAIELIAEHGDGSFRDSISLLDQMMHVADGEITAELVMQVLGLLPRESLQKLVDSLVAGDRTKVLDVLQSLDNGGGSTVSLANQLSQMLVTIAPEHPSLYELIDKLLEVPRAYNPRLKLLTILMSAMPEAPAKSTKEESKSAPALVTPAPEIPVITLAAPEPAPAPADGQLTKLDGADWENTLAAIKKTNSPLYTVLKHAQISFEDDKQTLTLHFKYQLHRKKLDDPKQKAALASAMTATLGAAPTIKTAMGDAKPADPTVASVADIMGGGELIEP